MWGYIFLGAFAFVNGAIALIAWGNWQRATQRETDLLNKIAAEHNALELSLETGQAAAAARTHADRYDSDVVQSAPLADRDLRD